MSIFGELDAEKIPTNPFWVEEGEYRAVIQEAAMKPNKDGDKTYLTIVFTILDENSEFEGKQVRSYMQVYPKMTKEDYSILPVEEKKIVNRNMSNVKKLLCGQPDQGRKGLGVDPSDLDKEDWDPKSLQNIEVNIAVSNYGPENEGVNLRWANLAS